jgi:hypothetical protein
LWGGPGLTGAARARGGRCPAGPAAELLDAVTDAAAALGTDRHLHHVWFGPTDAHLTGLYVALHLGHLEKLIDRAEKAELNPEFPANLRAAHYTILGYAYARRREGAAATLALLKLEQLSPEEIRYDRTVAVTLQLLLSRDHRAARSDVRRLAGLAGLL